MKAADNPVVGRWRIVEADLWDRDYLDLCGPATLVVWANGDGEIAFRAMQASLDIDYGPDEIGFTWTGFDEMTEVSGSGSAELQDDGSLLIEFAYHLGDEAVLKAVHTYRFRRARERPRFLLKVVVTGPGTLPPDRAPRDGPARQ